jgi:hypothetical protein
MRLPMLAVLAALTLSAGGVAACGEEDVSTERPRSTPELTLPPGDPTPGDQAEQDEGTTTTETTPTETGPTETAPTETAPTETEGASGTGAAPAQGVQQGAAAGSELEGFCEENPGAC